LKRASLLSILDAVVLGKSSRDEFGEEAFVPEKALACFSVTCTHFLSDIPFMKESATR